MRYAGDSFGGFKREESSNQICLLSDPPICFEEGEGPGPYSYIPEKKQMEKRLEGIFGTGDKTNWGDWNQPEVGIPSKEIPSDEPPYKPSNEIHYSWPIARGPRTPWTGQDSEKVLPKQWSFPDESLTPEQLERLRTGVLPRKAAIPVDYLREVITDIEPINPYGWTATQEMVNRAGPLAGILT